MGHHRAQARSTSSTLGGGSPPVHSNYLTVSTITTTETDWKRRYRAARLSLPSWARDNPDRLVYISNASGKFEVYAWDRATDEHRLVTDRPAGTGYMVPPRLDPAGKRIYWFDDAKGNELGHFRVELFGRGGSEPILEQLPPAYSARIAIASSFEIVGRSRSDEGTTIYLVRDDAEPKLVYSHPQSAAVVGISRDERLFAIAHSEHGDSRNRALRVLDLEGNRVAARAPRGPAAAAPVARPRGRRALPARARDERARASDRGTWEGERRARPPRRRGLVHLADVAVGADARLAHAPRFCVQTLEL